MNVGYSYWGFLADVKMNDKLEKLSTPDGNAFYSWSIIKELQKKYNVYSIMPDRDQYAVNALGKNAFSAWATDDRYNTYNNMYHIEYACDWKNIVMNDLFKIWDKYKFEYIIHEWRMPINGRNTLDMKSDLNWQPDLFIQMCLLQYCKLYSIKLFIFDLDYKLNVSDIIDKENTIVLELGTKWNYIKSIKSQKVYIPFDFNHINDFKIKPINERNTNLIYIGNRYERDWCIDKYIPDNLEKVIIHGNWKEGGRDSVEKWPKFDFRKRLQTEEMHDAYSDSVCTILLAKKDYCKYHFMTARIIEAIFYGTIPLFIDEYGFDTIHEYAGKHSALLTVHNATDVLNTIKSIKQMSIIYTEIIEYLRDKLSNMDAKYFVQILEDYK